ncbi:hypothetical protein SAMN04487905_102198 [Actinopolyspora xinjiangensis]|uniref:Uncharacterized protein n=1 Tax=Actinopolyspora xinjiangensis TaxID=405564 RepID=A0A1H0QF43_9ACTN|nr:hypothetical protein SAMN04487905_102198 [Actinopolyspora xinjiangensis]
MSRHSVHGNRLTTKSVQNGVRTARERSWTGRPTSTRPDASPTRWNEHPAWPVFLTRISPPGISPAVTVARPVRHLPESNVSDEHDTGQNLRPRRRAPRPGHSNRPADGATGPQVPREPAPGGRSRHHIIVETGGRGASTPRPLRPSSKPDEKRGEIDHASVGRGGFVVAGGDGSVVASGHSITHGSITHGVDANRHRPDPASSSPSKDPWCGHSSGNVPGSGSTSGPTARDYGTDFTAATAHPENPLRLCPEYDSGDGLHPRRSDGDAHGPGRRESPRTATNLFTLFRMSRSSHVFPGCDLRGVNTPANRDGGDQCA